MAENLPYSTSVRTLEKMLEKIKTASVPERFTQSGAEVSIFLGEVHTLITRVSKSGGV